jgi:hypothetical protein
VPEPINIVLEDVQYRRALAVAGRQSQSVDEWATGIIEKVIAAEEPGKVNPVLHDMARPERLQLPTRHCKYCGEELKQLATARRAYCSDLCRVRAWRLRTGTTSSSAP